MPRFPGFCGPSNTQRSLTIDDERTVNWYPVRGYGGTPQAEPVLEPTPGLKPFAYLGSGSVRALFYQDGHAYGVGGATFFEITPGGRAIPKGAVQTGGNPATISSNGQNGHQLFITSGGNGYIYDTTTEAFSQITDDAFPSYVVQGLFFDGYFIALDGTTGKFNLSTLYDGLEWNGLDFALESQFSDTVIAMTRTHDNLWLFGTKNTGPWYDAGSGNQSFVPVPGSLIEHGTAAPFACVEVNNAPIWLVANEAGAGMVVRANGYAPDRISSFALEYELSKLTTYAQARAFAYQEAGHYFYVLNVPGLETTWVYDLGVNEWHERGVWNIPLGRYTPYPAACHCFAFGKHLVGDPTSGAVYEQHLPFQDARGDWQFAEYQLIGA